MSLKFIGTTMPESWRWGHEENKIIKIICDQIENKWPTQKNLFVNLTWFGPGFGNGVGWNQVVKIIEDQEKFDNVFFLASVDPTFITPDQRQYLEQNLNCSRCFWMGNFQTDYEFNFFAIVGQRLFHRYNIDEVLMKEPKHLFLNYNRKPRQHRVDFVKKLLSSGLSELGVFTLGKDDTKAYSDQSEELYFTINEKDESYADCGHTSNPNTFGIPDDVLSLHNIKIWQHHFLNIVGATEFFPWDPVFVTESQWKPMIGLRAFVINGNTKTYQWLENYGFKTFNHLFPVDLEVNELEVHDTIIDALRWLKDQDLTALYKKILPDLLHNQQHFYKFAQQQEHKLHNLFAKVTS